MPDDARGERPAEGRQSHAHAIVHAAEQHAGRKPVTTYTDSVARMTSHGATSSDPIIIATPNTSHPPTFNSV
jgi:hypothetical protein